MINKQEFLEWLHEIMYLLPPKMTLHEARLLFERKIQEDEEKDNNE